MTYESHDICVWADGTTCLYEDLDEYLTFMSDDFEVIQEDVPHTLEVDEFMGFISNKTINWCNSDMR